MLVTINNKGKELVTTVSLAGLQEALESGFQIVDAMDWEPIFISNLNVIKELFDNGEIDIIR